MWNSIKSINTLILLSIISINCAAMSPASDEQMICAADIVVIATVVSANQVGCRHKDSQGKCIDYDLGSNIQLRIDSIIAQREGEARSYGSIMYSPKVGDTYKGYANPIPLPSEIAIEQSRTATPENRDAHTEANLNKYIIGNQFIFTLVFASTTPKSFWATHAWHLDEEPSIRKIVNVDHPSVSCPKLLPNGAALTYPELPASPGPYTDGETLARSMLLDPRTTRASSYSDVVAYFAAKRDIAVLAAQKLYDVPNCPSHAYPTKLPTSSEMTDSNFSEACRNAIQTEATARVAIASASDLLIRLTRSQEERDRRENKAWMTCRHALEILISGENDNLDAAQQQQNRDAAAVALSAYAKTAEHRIDAPYSIELEVAYSDWLRVAADTSYPIREEKLFARILFIHGIASRIGTLISVLHTLQSDDVSNDKLFVEMLNDVNPKINALIENYYGTEPSSTRGNLKLTDLYK